MHIIYNDIIDENINVVTNNANVTSVIHTGLAYDVNNLFNINRIQNSLQPRSAILSKIINIRINPIDRRIRDIFIEIDLLGNYTQSTWFSNLDCANYYRFYQYIYYIWFTSGILSFQTKRIICPFYDPFVFQVQHLGSENDNIDEARQFCLSIIENLVYGGIDIEFRKIAVLHILSALTMVSIPARNNMIWLYESLNSILPS
jgi:hypothetical protein